MNRESLNKLFRLTLPCLASLGLISILSLREASTSAHVKTIGSGAEEAAPASLQSGNTYVVTRTDDPAPDGCVTGDCSLREAIIAANESPGTDAITVPAGTYTLTRAGGDDTGLLGDLDISESVAISGAGAGSTIIQAGNNDRIFHIVNASNVAISHMTIRNGSDGGGGGGIYNSGTLVLYFCTITGNSTTGGNGGGILSGFNASTIIRFSTISGNSSRLGGAIFSSGKLTRLEIQNSTISGNTASLRGGALFTDDSGADIINSTVSGNRAFEGGAMTAGNSSVIRVNITSSTFSDNVATDNPNTSLFFDFGPTYTIKNSIFSAPASACGSIVNAALAGRFINAGGNFTTSCAILGATTTQLNLGPLQDNGGPTQTHALLPGSVAIDAVTDCGGLSNDQRGFSRPADGNGDGVSRCDSGAFEAGGAQTNLPPVIICPGDLDVVAGLNGQATVTYNLPLAFDSNGVPTPVTCTPPSGSTFNSGVTRVNCATSDSFGGSATCSFQVVVRSLTFTVTRTDDPPPDGCQPGDCSLREAIIAANNLLNPSTIGLPAGTYTLTIPGIGEEAGATGDLDITRSVTIFGAGAGSTIIQAGTSSPVSPGACSDCIDRVFHIVNSSTVVFNDLTIRNGIQSIVGGQGGGIYSNSALTLNNCVVSNNFAADKGGGIFAGAGVSLNNSKISDNLATDGGGIFHTSANSINNSTISGNRALANGGGLGSLIGFGGTSLNYSTISGNTAGGSGGGIRGTVEMNNSTISGNSAGSGGGISAASGGINIAAVSIYNSTLSGNSAVNSAVSGGNINISTDTRFTIQNSIVANSPSGGAINATPFDGNVTDLGGNFITNILGPLPPFGVVVTSAQLNLGPLQDNGGPTQTHALLPGSVAIDALTFCDVTTDQRGERRPIDGNGDGAARCDSGAYEAPVPPACAAISVINPTTTTGTVGASFSQTFSQTGGVAPITFSLDSGTPPPGLTLAANGVLSGAPTQAGVFSFTVKATGAGNCFGIGATYTLTIDKANTTTTITSDNPDSSAAGQSVTVNFTVAVAPPGAGSPTGDVTVSDGVNSCTGTVASGSCSLVLNTPGNRTLTATYSGDGNFNGGSDTEAHTVVAQPVISKSFNPSSVPIGGVSILSFTITNPAANTVALTGVGFTDAWPANLVASTPLAVSNTCGGVLLDAGGGTINAGDTGIKLDGGSVGVAPGNTCVVAVQVRPTAAGPFVNVTGNVTSTNGGTGNTATATLSTTAAIAPPTITGATITVKAGSAPASFTIGSAADPNQAANTLGIKINGGSSATSNGVTVNNLAIAPSGAVTAKVSTSCSAQPGNRTFNLVVTDSQGATGAGTLTVTVTPEMTPPVITVIGPNPMTVLCPIGFIDLGAIGADNCSGLVNVTRTGTVNAGIPGQYTITYSATDAAGNTATATRVVNVVDEIPPSLTLKPAIKFWPPNHGYQTVTMAQMVAGVSDGCNTSLSINDVKIEKVTSDEPDDAPGDSDGATTNDVAPSADCKSVQLRSERDETRNGRVYKITLRVRDSSGNATRKVFTVSVPKSNNGASAGDSGVAYTKTSGCP